MTSRNSVSAFRYFRSDEAKPVQLELQSKKFEIKQVVQTVVSRAKIEVVLSQDDTARYRCRYRIKSSERQRLTILLPEGAEPHSVLVDNRQVSLEKSGQTPPEKWSAYYVSVARSKNSDEAFQLTLLFTWPMNPAPFQLWRGKLQLPMPRVGLPSETNAVTQQIQATVWVPKDYKLVGTPSKFIVTSRPRLCDWLPEVSKSQNDDNWVGSTNELAQDFPTQGKRYQYSNLGGAEYLKVVWWHSTGFTVVLSGVLALIGLILVRTTWENKLGFLVFLALGVILWAQVNSDLMTHVVHAARFGFIALMLLWIVNTFANWFGAFSFFTKEKKTLVAGAESSGSSTAQPETNTAGTNTARTNTAGINTRGVGK